MQRSLLIKWTLKLNIYFLNLWFELTLGKIRKLEIKFINIWNNLWMDLIIPIEYKLDKNKELKKREKYWQDKTENI